jgi:hypothetical protein
MRELQREGLVRSIGLTGVGETQAVIDAIRTGLFDFVQCYYNALNPSASHAGASGGGQDFGAALRIAQELGVGGMAVRSVAGGALVANDYRSPLAGPTGTGGGLGGNPYSNDLVRAQRLQPLVEAFGLENARRLLRRRATRVRVTLGQPRPSPRRRRRASRRAGANALGRGMGNPSPSVPLPVHGEREAQAFARHYLGGIVSGHQTSRPSISSPCTGRRCLS